VSGRMRASSPHDDGSRDASRQRQGCLPSVGLAAGDSSRDAPRQMQARLPSVGLAVGESSRGAPWQRQGRLPRIGLAVGRQQQGRAAVKAGRPPARRLRSAPSRCRPAAAAGTRRHSGREGTRRSLLLWLGERVEDRMRGVTACGGNRSELKG
jgi:hypothetical protein